jgi:hypothetical protein
MNLRSGKRLLYARKPPNAGKGRPKGSSNKTTAVLKDGILKAAENAGNGDIVT